MGSSSKRAVVLGADIEGLAAAATLAQSGREVHVVDGRAQAGGVAQSVEFAPGHRAPGLLHETALVRRELLAHLNLEQHGLRWRAEECPLHVLGNQGTLLNLARNAVDPKADAEAYTRWRAFVDRLAPLINEVIDGLPPQAEEPGLKDIAKLGMLGLKLRRLGQEDMMELLRIVTMPAWDWMEECFDDPTLRAGLTAQVLCGSVLGPRAAGTTAMLLMREAARGVEPIGGLAAVSQALQAACEALGVQLHLGVAPVQVLVEGDRGTRTSGVRLENGESLAAGLVLSALDPVTSLLELVHPGLVPHHVESEVKHWRTRGSSAVHLLALSQAPALPGQAERLLTCSTPLQLERCADALKYGELPEAPWLDIRHWSRSESDCAPQGAGTLSVQVHGVPYDLRGGWSPEARQRLRSSILSALDAAAPGLSASISADELLVPTDLEQRFGMRGGHLYGGEVVLDQLWVQRPCLALSRYATPLPGYFLGGASSHPGAAFAGGAGVLAARQALGG